MLEKEIRDVFSASPDVLYAFADISYSSYAEEYKSALVTAFPYGGQLTEADYTEEGFEEGIQSAKGRLEKTVAAIEEILQRHGAKYWVPPVAQQNETELRALFSFKTAAAHAGIGWFGKNDVIITDRYGPRVRLSAILIDEVFKYGEPITRGKCPEDCTKCIDICPCKALKNRQWTEGMDRSEIIDYQKCNRMRSAFIRKLGRKSACVSAWQYALSDTGNRRPERGKRASGSRIPPGRSGNRSSRNPSGTSRGCATAAAPESSKCTRTISTGNVSCGRSTRNSARHTCPARRDRTAAVA